METVAVLLIIFVGFPIVLFHFITKWKTASTITEADENLLDELHDLARRLDDRMCTLERIIQAENPNWRQLACGPDDLVESRDRVRRLRDERAQRMLERSIEEDGFTDDFERAPARPRSNQPDRRNG